MLANLTFVKAYAQSACICDVGESMLVLPSRKAQLKKRIFS